MEYEAAEKKKISGLPTAKQLREVTETVYAQIKREEEAEEKVGLVSMMFLVVFWDWVFTIQRVETEG